MDGFLEMKKTCEKKVWLKYLTWFLSKRILALVVCVALIYLIEWSEWSKKDIQEKRRKTWWKFSPFGIIKHREFHPSRICFSSNPNSERHSGSTDRSVIVKYSRDNWGIMTHEYPPCRAYIGISHEGRLVRGTSNYPLKFGPLLFAWFFR